MTTRKDKLARLIANEVINTLAAMSNYEVELMLHCRQEQATRADRLDAEDKLQAAIGSLLEDAGIL